MRKSKLGKYRPRAIARRWVCALLSAAIATSAQAADPGAESPDALMKKLGAAAAAQDIAVVVSCIAPHDRSFLSFMLGMVSIEMTGAMLAQFASAPGGPPAADLERRMKEYDEGYQKLLTRHKVERFDPSTEVDMNDPAALGKLAESRLGHVDHAAFVADSVAFLEAVGVSGSDGERNPLRRFETEVKQVHINGDRASVEVVNVERPIELTRIEGRWYLLLIPTDL